MFQKMLVKMMNFNSIRNNLSDTDRKEMACKLMMEMAQNFGDDDDEI